MRLVIFTSSSSPYAPYLLEPFLDKYHSKVAAVITINLPKQSKLKKIRNVTKKAGVRYAILKLILFGVLRLRQMIGSFPSVTSLCRKYTIQRHKFESIESPRLIELMNSIQPEILLSVLFEKIFPMEILSIPKIAAINFHPAPLPRYAGVAPTFWVLSNNESATAATLHYIIEDIDAGDILSQIKIPIVKHDTVHSLYLRCCEAGSAMVAEAFDKISKGEVNWQKQDVVKRSYFSSPTKEGYRQLRANGFSLYTIGDLFSTRKHASNT